jgi:hypothetical protein
VCIALAVSSKLRQQGIAGFFHVLMGNPGHVIAVYNNVGNGTPPASIITGMRGDEDI